jgi:hypothetical protein
MCDASRQKYYGQEKEGEEGKETKGNKEAPIGAGSDVCRSILSKEKSRPRVGIFLSPFSFLHFYGIVLFHDFF